MVALINSDGNVYKSISKDSHGKKLFRGPEQLCVITEVSCVFIYVSDSITSALTHNSTGLEALRTFRFPKLDTCVFHKV